MSSQPYNLHKDPMYKLIFGDTGVSKMNNPTVDETDDENDALITELAKSYFSQQSMLSEGFGEASFSHELKQLFIIANDYYQKEQNNEKFDYMDFVACSALAMRIMLKEMNAHFETIATIKAE